eukprot:778498-Pyramimonas_sp.AAC.1
MISSSVAASSPSSSVVPQNAFSPDLTRRAMPLRLISSWGILIGTEYPALKTVAPKTHPWRPPLCDRTTVSSEPCENHDPSCSRATRE